MRWICVLLSAIVCCQMTPAAGVEAPKLVPPNHAGLGRYVPNLEAKTIAGVPYKLVDALKDKKGAVIAITSVNCPLSKKFLPTLAQLEAEYAKKGIAFLLIDPISTDTVDELKTATTNAKWTAPVLHDSDGHLAKTLGARSTTDLFVMDARRTVVYRGAVDDQYGRGYSTDAPKHTYAKDALEALLHDRAITVKATTAPGCVLDLDAATFTPDAPTYHNRISRLVQQNCLECHRKGGVGPFELNSREQLLANKGMIKKVVSEGTMPPWHASEPKKGEARPFKNDRSLTEADKADLLTWFANAAPLGDEADAPLPRTFSAEWSIGKPDLVVEMPKPISVKATGFMEYQNVYIDTGLTEDKWVVAAEVKPSDIGVVHHIIAFAVPQKKPGEIEIPRRGEGQGYFAVYVPGNSFQILPEGFGRRLPKGSRLKLQIHYTPNGTATKDQTKVAFRFADKVPENEIRVLPIGNPKIEIPAGADNHPEYADYKLPVNAVVTAFSPHMHVRGKACRYEVETKDGGKKVLLDVPHYDFNWQLRYELAEPIAIDKGTKAYYTAWYDNSSKNPANPDPTKVVKWGDQTYEEMMLGYVEFYIPMAAKPPVK